MARSRGVAAQHKLGRVGADQHEAERQPQEQQELGAETGGTVSGQDWAQARIIIGSSSRHRAWHRPGSDRGQLSLVQVLVRMRRGRARQGGSYGVDGCGNVRCGGADDGMSMESSVAGSSLSLKFSHSLSLKVLNEIMASFFKPMQHFG